MPFLVGVMVNFQQQQRREVEDDGNAAPVPRPAEIIWRVGDNELFLSPIFVQLVVALPLLSACRQRRRCLLRILRYRAVGLLVPSSLFR